MTYGDSANNPRTDWLIEQLWAPTERPKGSAVWMILDGARDERVYDMVRYSRMDRSCLYAGPHPEVLLRAAPHLVRFTQGTLFPREVLTAAWGNSWGVMLTTVADLDTLRKHLRGFLRVRDERARRLVFRYYDPRVLREYLPTCRPQELETVFGPIESFIVEGRDGDTMLRFTREKGQLVTETLPVVVKAPTANAR